MIYGLAESLRGCRMMPSEFFLIFGSSGLAKRLV